MQKHHQGCDHCRGGGGHAKRGSYVGHVHIQGYYRVSTDRISIGSQGRIGKLVVCRTSTIIDESGHHRSSSGPPRKVACSRWKSKRGRTYCRCYPSRATAALHHLQVTFPRPVRYHPVDFLRICCLSVPHGSCSRPQLCCLRSPGFPIPTHGACLEPFRAT